jgi:bacterioferritin
MCGNAKDYATREILERILQEEDGHINDIESIQDQIKQMGIEQFPATQTS